jgi:hypothetical protein
MNILLNRINTYINTRAINPRTVTRRQYRQMGDMVPVSEVQIIVAMIMADNIEKFFDQYDQIAPADKRTQELPPPPSSRRQENDQETKVVELDLTPQRVEPIYSEPS